MFEMTPSERADMVRFFEGLRQIQTPPNSTHAHPLFAQEYPPMPIPGYLSDLQRYADRLTVEVYLQRIGVRF